MMVLLITPSCSSTTAHEGVEILSQTKEEVKIAVPLTTESFQPIWSDKKSSIASISVELEQERAVESVLIYVAVTNGGTLLEESKLQQGEKISFVINKGAGLIPFMPSLSLAMEKVFSS